MKLMFKNESSSRGMHLELRTTHLLKYASSNCVREILTYRHLFSYQLLGTQRETVTDCYLIWCMLPRIDNPFNCACKVHESYQYSFSRFLI